MFPVTMTYTRHAIAIAIATGIPEPMSPRKRSLKVPGPIPYPPALRETLSNVCSLPLGGGLGRGSSFHLVGELWSLEHRVAAFPVRSRHPNGAPGHEGEPEG